MGPCRVSPQPAATQWYGHFSTERHGTPTQGTEGALDHQPRAPKVSWTATHEASRPSASSSLAREFLSSFVGSIPLRTDLTRPRSRDLLRKVHVSHGCHIGTSLIQSRTCHEEFKHLRRFYQDWCLKSIKKRIWARVSRHSQDKPHTERGRTCHMTALAPLTPNSLFEETHTT